MEKTLENKVVLITGGTSGIGRASAIAFAKAGAKVVVAGRREKEGEETVHLVQKAGAKGFFCKTDVTQEKDVEGLIEKTLHTYGKLDIALNNSGIGGSDTLVADTALEDYQSVFDTNVKGVFLSMKHEIPAMLKNKSGAIINISSIAGVVGVPTAACYSASKHAVIGLTKSAALEYAKQNIRINAICPAAIETNMFNAFSGGKETEMGKKFIELHPLGRIGRPEEIASVAVFLASSAASFITGQSVRVDGGFTAQ